ncbi:MAG: ATP-binding protein, partial [Paludibacteraceae bacterium]|nr:ATP-binding protein [Paludibacteraceae bacterium]
DYMRTRISRQVVLELNVEGNVRVMLNVPLFAWIIENMCKNAVDAIDGQGLVHIRVHADNRKAYVDVEDNGRGMSKQVARRVFEPGFTTKKRGWGLGMPLVKRIVEEYHGGRIFIMRTAPGAGTAFRLEFARLDAASDAVSE